MCRIGRSCVRRHSAQPRLRRLDRLLLLLDTGSSASVRTTAAKQLAQLAAKSVISDVALVEDDVKTTRHHVSISDSSGWSELMAVVARVSPPSSSIVCNGSSGLDTAISAFKIS